MVRTGVVVEDKQENRLEKIMTSWSNRYRHGSNKNKSPHLPDDDSRLADMVRICQIIYELYSKLTTARGLWNKSQADIY